MACSRPARHSEWPIHSEIFRKRSDVNVMVQSEGQALARSLGRNWAAFIANHGVTFAADGADDGRSVRSDNFNNTGNMR